MCVFAQHCKQQKTPHVSHSRWCVGGTSRGRTVKPRGECLQGRSSSNSFEVLTFLRVQNVTEVLTQPCWTVSGIISRLPIVLSKELPQLVYLTRCYTTAWEKSSVVQRHFQMNSVILLCRRKVKHNSARNAICVRNPETIKTAIYNEGNKGLMKRLRQSFADPPWPAHEKGSGRQNAYKASSLPLWSDAENSPSGAIVTFSLWQSSNSHTDNRLCPDSPPRRLGGGSKQNTPTSVCEQLISPKYPPGGFNCTLSICISNKDMFVPKCDVCKPGLTALLISIIQIVLYCHYEVTSLCPTFIYPEHHGAVIAPPQPP